MDVNCLKAAEPYWEHWYLRDNFANSNEDSNYILENTSTEKKENSLLKIISMPQSTPEYRETTSTNEDNYAASQYYKRLLLELYREIRCLECMRDPYVLIYKEHFILRRTKTIGYDIFLRTEYLPTISQVWSLRMDTKIVFDMAIAVLKGLKRCETVGILHGSITPDSIFTNEKEKYKIGNFSFLQCMGYFNVAMNPLSPYLAPELAMGLPFDYRADIYSLGIIMFQYINGGLPGKTTSHNEVDQVILKACAVSPEQRYQSLDEFYNAIIAVSIFLTA